MFNYNNLNAYYFIEYDYRYEECKHGNITGHGDCPEGTLLYRYISEKASPEDREILLRYNKQIIPNKDLGWDIKAKENKQECRDIKEVDRISCLVLNLVKICEKNPKLHYCMIENYDGKEHINTILNGYYAGESKNDFLFKNFWKEDTEFRVISETIDYLKDDLIFYKDITVSILYENHITFYLKRIGDKYKIVSVSYSRVE